MGCRSRRHERVVASALPAVGFESTRRGWDRVAIAVGLPVAARRRGARGLAASVALAVAFVMACLSSVAWAHGPVAPVATDYLARVSRAPVGLEAKVVDGYLRLWLRVKPGEGVEVLDYLGAPYLRFARTGVYVNENSEMYYLNYPLPLRLPAGLSRRTPPRWHRVSSGHEYEWHDGRIGGLTEDAAAPGASYLGQWRVAVLVNGRLGAIAGGLWHAGGPSIVWFWPIVVLLACLPAAWRLRRRELDALLARGLALLALAAVAVGGAGKELHGRPTIGIPQLVLLGLVLAFVAGAAVRVLRGRHGLVLLFAVASIALLVGAELASTLVHGFVLIALPAFLARMATVLCLGCGVGMLPVPDPAARPRGVGHACSCAEAHRKRARSSPWLGA